MLDVGSFVTRDCQGMTRRAFVRAAWAAPFAWQLAGQQASWPNLRAIIDFEIEYQKTAKNAGEDCGCEVTLPSPLN